MTPGVGKATITLDEGMYHRWLKDNVLVSNSAIIA